MNLRWRSAVAWMLTDWGLKVTALGLAFLIWALARADSPAADVLAEVPVEIVLRDAAWDTVGGPAPSTVSLRISGPVRELARLRMGGPTVVRVLVDNVDDSVQTVLLQPRNVVWGVGDGENLRVDAITPDQVRLDLDPVVHQLLPVAPQVRGEPPPGFELAGPVRADPATVRASGARRRLARVDSLRLQPIDLSARRGVDTVTLSIDTMGTGLLITPQRVRVIVPLRRLPGDSLRVDSLGVRPDTAAAAARPRGLPPETPALPLETPGLPPKTPGLPPETPALR